MNFKVITSALTLGLLVLIALINSTIAGGGRDFYYKTYQTHPHGYHHHGGHSKIYHEQHIPAHHGYHHGYHHGPHHYGHHGHHYPHHGYHHGHHHHHPGHHAVYGYEIHAGHI